MTIKKQFVELVNLLESNKDKKVSTILDEIYSLVESKKKETTYILDQDGNPFAIFCWYHKQWELLSEVEYGSKASHHSGYNIMCKIGVNKWTKQQSVVKNAKTALLDEVVAGKLTPKDVSSRVEEIENQRYSIDMDNSSNGSIQEPTIKY